MLERSFDDRRRGPVELDGEQKPKAAHLAECTECRCELGRDLPYVLEEGLVDCLDDGARSSAGDRVAAEGRGVVAGLEARRCVV